MHGIFGGVICGTDTEYLYIEFRKAFESRCNSLLVSLIAPNHVVMGEDVGDRVSRSNG